MPSKPLRTCLKPGCKRLTQGGYCQEHKPEGRTTSKGYQALYSEGAYRRARAVFMAEHPFCAECEKQGRQSLSTELDHIKPHKGNRALFYGTMNWQALCKPCHDAKTAREDGGFGNSPRPKKF